MALDVVNDILRMNDIDVSMGCIQYAERGNLLLKVIDTGSLADHNLLKVTMYQPDGFGYHERFRDHMVMPTVEPRHDSAILWKSNEPLPPTGRLLWMFNVEQEQFLSSELNLGYLYDRKSSWSSAPTPQVGTELRMLEMFSGSFGGWKGAAKYLNAETDASFQTIAVDHDPTACTNYALNHSANFLKSAQGLHEDLFVNSVHSWVVCTDVTDKDLMRPISKWAPQVASVSAPCPPWSNSGTGGGLDRPEGMLLIRTLIFLRWLRVAFVVIEQVASITRHAHFKVILDVIHQLGFKLAWHRTADFSDIGRVNRPRWLALLARISANIDPMPAQFWARVDRQLLPNPHMNLPSQHREEMLLQGDAIHVATNPEYLKYRGASLKGKADMDILSLRIFNGGQIPCFMARYGTQHWLSEELLADQGYHANFAVDRELAVGWRHWHPAEIAVMHGFITPIWLSRDHLLAWFGLGNMITIQHSIMALILHEPKCFFQDTWSPKTLEMSASSHCTSDHHTLGLLIFLKSAASMMTAWHPNLVSK